MHKARLCFCCAIPKTKIKSTTKGRVYMYDYERLEQYAEKIGTKIGFQPKVGLVLGTGLGDMAEKIETVYEVPFTSLNGFPVSTVEGHVGHFLFGYMEDVPIVCMQGRVHYYEGYSMEDVVLPIRFMATMGVESIILTNAAGGINKDFNVGDIMVITDHISSFVPNPLIGKNVDHFGVRFPDMSNIYDKQMRETFVNVAKQNGIPVREGVYIQFTGPSFESPAEIRMAAALGADAVGMSTACEAIAARHAKVKVCGLSYISNAAAGLSDKELSHEDVRWASKFSAENVEKMLRGYFRSIKE